MVKKNKYGTLDNLPGEVLTDIRALVDQFLIAFANINKYLWVQYFMKTFQMRMFMNTRHGLQNCERWAKAKASKIHHIIVSTTCITINSLLSNYIIHVYMVAEFKDIFRDQTIQVYRAWLRELGQLEEIGNLIPLSNFSDIEFTKFTLISIILCRGI